MKGIFSGKGRIHFIGIGGIGMSAIAKIFLEMGFKVSGSDLELNNLTDELKSLGAGISEGHDGANVPHDAEAAVYSSAVDKTNPEVVAVKRMGIPLVQRAYALGEILDSKKGIAVTGTHGKTTTTSLISVMLAKNGLDPTIAVGAQVPYFGSNARLGGSGWMVAEADESDGSFRHIRPLYAVVTNIEMEHMDYYKTIGDVLKGYALFLNNIKKGGALFYNADDENVMALLKAYKGRKRSFGISESERPDIYPADIKLEGFKSSYRCVYKERSLGTVRLKIPGMHNISNSLACILVGLEMGLKFKDIVKAISYFRGADRRFQTAFSGGGVMLIEDYAHHPTEIKAVIGAAGGFAPRRLISVFQPHRFTRTKYLKKEFGRCFAGSDALILTDIYPASERPIKGISVKTLYDEVKRFGLPGNVEMVAKDAVARRLFEESRRGDMILIMGAGDIKGSADELARRFRMRQEFKFLGKRARFDEPLSRHTTFRIGGPAEAWIEPADTSELRRVLLGCKKNNWKIFVMGRGSNILARDEGWRGVVVNLSSPHFRRLRIKGATVNAGAGCNLGLLISKTCRAGLGGLESLVGIPGTVGGAVYMNAGGAANPAFDNMGKYVESLKVMDKNGAVRGLSRGEVAFGYRSSGLAGYIVLGATLALSKSDKDALFVRAADFLRLKKSKQALDAPSAGCIFKNPSNSQFTAGQMIDMLGLKGRRIGGAKVSAKHANFIINAGGATSSDVERLADYINGKVREAYGFSLEYEVERL